ncbi:hypothetical protein QP157_01430 [Sphingomonas sp. LR61]
MATPGGADDRGVAVGVPGLQVGARSHEHVDRPTCVAVDRQRQRRPPLGVGELQRRAAAQEFLEHLGPVEPRGGVQRGEAPARVDVVDVTRVVRQVQSAQVAVRGGTHHLGGVLDPAVRHRTVPAARWPCVELRVDGLGHAADRDPDAPEADRDLADGGDEQAELPLVELVQVLELTAHDVGVPGEQCRGVGVGWVHHRVAESERDPGVVPPAPQAVGGVEHLVVADDDLGVHDDRVGDAVARQVDRRPGVVVVLVVRVRGVRVREIRVLDVPSCDAGVRPLDGQECGDGRGASSSTRATCSRCPSKSSRET